MELRLRRTEDVEEKVYKVLEPWCRLSLSQVPFSHKPSVTTVSKQGNMITY